MSSSPRMPVAFVPHAGGPITHVELGFPEEETAAFARYWRSLRELPRTPPKAVLAVSAHWERPSPTVMSASRPPMFYDYGGFPPEAYQLTWPSPGAPELAGRVRDLLGKSGFSTDADPVRGYDHGTFTPLKQTYPDADVPVIQLSLVRGLDAAQHVAMGRALAPLRDEGVFIVGSGDTFHNMGAFGRGGVLERSREFDGWLTALVTGPADARDRGLERWVEGPNARFCHPREEHLIPLMVVAGAAGADVGVKTFTGEFMGSQQTGYHFG
ncbi:MAG: dioxygenase [Myxococcaceae bacterium]|nr:dioxygenase [Myxococcaceae bacterium]